MVKLSFTPSLHELNGEGAYKAKDGILFIGGVKSKGLAGFHPLVREASRIINEGGKVEMLEPMMSEVDRYQLLSQLLDESN